MSAEHLSVGYEDSLGTGAQEAPNDKSVDADAYARGISTGCYDPSERSVNQGDLEDARKSDPFCGQLLYQPDSQLFQKSPKDQKFHTDAIGAFDVITTRSYMLAHEARLLHKDVGACQPFCDDNPAGQAAWTAVHTAGDAAGLTHGPSQADSRERSDRLQVYGADVHTLTARQVLQEIGTHEMDGWYIPGVTRSFVAYLEDDAGNAIGEQKLKQILAPLKEKGKINQDAVPSVCGFTPDADFVGTGGAVKCEVPFSFEGSSDVRTDFQDGYKDKCKSAAYVCSAASAGAWYADFDCICNTLALSGDSGVNDYIRWHFVVAPTLPDCAAREPTFLTSAQATGTDKPFLAHDVDVYTSPFALQATDEARGTTAAVATVTSSVDDEVEEATEGVDAVDGTTVQGPTQVSKDDRIEPNADPVGSLEDTSQHLPDTHTNGGDLSRTLEGCGALTSSEDENTVDPWVDIIDGETRSDLTTGDVIEGDFAPRSTGGVNVSIAGAGVQTVPGLYDNGAEDQDNDNHPGPALYTTSGKVGLFTDKNDDGDYDQVAGDTLLFSESKNKNEDIQDTGAYPMIWDLDLKTSGGEYVIDTESGCTIRSTTITQGAKSAGFGPNTGLFQAVYLNEPTVFVNPATGSTVPYTGNNIYLFLSSSARTLYQDSGTNHVKTAIQDAVDELKAYAGSDPDIRQPGQAFGFDSDFQTQCLEDTGGFTLKMSFTHAVQAGGDGDTIVTGYPFELTTDTIGGGEENFLPPFSVNGDVFQFGAGQYSWTDVDPFDNDPGRQDSTDDRPPTGGD